MTLFANSAHSPPLPPHLPDVEADGVHHCRLDYLLPREHPPGDGNGLGGVAVGDVLCPLAVDHVVIDKRVGHQDILQVLHKLQASKKLQVGLSGQNQGTIQDLSLRTGVLTIKVSWLRCPGYGALIIEVSDYVVLIMVS